MNNIKKEKDTLFPLISFNFADDQQLINVVNEFRLLSFFNPKHYSRYVSASEYERMRSNHECILNHGCPITMLPITFFRSCLRERYMVKNHIVKLPPSDKSRRIICEECSVGLALEHNIYEFLVPRGITLKSSTEILAKPTETDNTPLKKFKLTIKEVEKIRQMSKDGHSITDIYSFFSDQKVGRSTISDIVNYRTWKITPEKI